MFTVVPIVHGAYDQVNGRASPEYDAKGYIMSNQQEVKKTDEQGRSYRPKIYRVDAKGKVLDFQDFILLDQDKSGTLSEGKIVLNYTEYDVTTHKAKLMLKHYLDVDVARTVFSDILGYRFRKNPNNQGYYLPLVDEYKGGRGAAAGHEEWEWASRHLIVDFNDQLRIGPAVRFNLTLGEGIANTTGAIMPKEKDAPYKGSIMVPLAKARSAAATILDYINCVQTNQMIRAKLDEANAMVVLDEVNAMVKAEMNETEARINDKLAKMAKMMLDLKTAVGDKESAAV